MNAGEFIEALERFFLDIIGTVLPGLVMIVGFCYVTNTPAIEFSKVLFNKPSDYEWVFIIAFSFILGHAITAIGYRITSNLEKFCKADLVKEAFDDKKGCPLFHFVKSDKDIEEELTKDPIYNAFVIELIKRSPGLSTDDKPNTKARAWRNMAMSIAPDQSQLVYRFMFIALLNLGASTVCLCLLALWVSLLVLKSCGVSMSVAELNWAFFALAILPYFLLDRFYSFNGRDFKTPFSMALAKLAYSGEGSKSVDANRIPVAASGQRLVVYLAGGFKSKWQEKVIKDVPGLDYLDPSSHGLNSKKDYTAWDLEAIKRSDCIFAYMEASNPGGYALSLEVGFGKALGKFVIFVDEKTNSGSLGGRYLDMVAEAADVTFASLEEGLAFLKKYQTLN
jgi:hypothetical protein